MKARQNDVDNHVYSTVIIMDTYNSDMEISKNLVKASVICLN